MPESKEHIAYVNNLYNFVCEIVPENCKVLIYTDSFNDKDRPTSVINGFIPDLYYKFDNMLVIGEAKTNNDVDRKHSLEQYESYLLEAERFDGESVLVFSVSWVVFATLKNIIRSIKRANSFQKCKIYVINDKGDISVL